MKRLLLLVSIFLTIFVGRIYAVAPSEYINDEANILTIEQKQTLNNLVNDFEKKTGNEVAVFIIPELKNETIEGQAVKTFEEWGVGKKGQDNGVLLLVSLKDRQLRIEVGYGLEGVLTDLKSSQIIRDIITPEFKNNNYFLGIQNGLVAMIGVISGDSSALPPEKPTVKFDENLIGLVVFIGYILFVIIAKTKSWWLGGVIGAVIGIWYGSLLSTSIFVVIGLIIDFILSLLGRNARFMNVVHTLGRLSSGGRSGGGGGFGGGRSGGGGSSGSW